MNVWMVVAAISAGLVVGIFSGLVGVGGGILLIPILVYGFKFNQKLAQGTSLAMLLPPTGLLAFLEYYRAGNAKLGLGLLMSLGVFLGGFAGGKWAQAIPQAGLRKGFAVFLVIIAVKMFFQK
jgi:uncharacterized membrane protein YfcA